MARYARFARARRTGPSVRGRGNLARRPATSTCQSAARVRESGPAGVHPDADAHLGLLRPRLISEPALDRERRFERMGRTAEDREELVGAGVDLVPARRANARPDRRAEVTEQPRVVVAEALQ